MPIMKPQPLSKAFTHAFNGLLHFIKHDRNGKIHVLMGVIVVLAGIFFNVSVVEWGLLLLCMAVMVSLEMFNHALENICDIVHQNTHPLMKTAKDVAAGAVLWSAIISAIIGILIFLPKIMVYL
jgi:diacylglycerol kinase